MALKHCMLWLRPSRLLGFFFFSQLFLLFTLVWWEKVGTNRLLLGHPCPDITMQNWLFLAGIEAAVTGWVVTSFMTLRNSIKQHTINTLLQTRLSATYMAEASAFNKAFFPPNVLTYEPVPLEYFQNEENADTVRAVNYLINYFEFMSVAIRHGDLDGKVVRHTLGGILDRFYTRMRPYIAFQRGDDGTKVLRPRQVEHLTWLVTKWSSKETKRQRITRFLRSVLPSA